MASVRFSSASNGSGSISKSNSPFWTLFPSLLPNLSCAYLLSGSPRKKSFFRYPVTRALISSAFRIAENPVEDNIEEVPRLGFRGPALAGEIVGEHGPIDQVADVLADAVHGDMAQPAGGDQDPVQIQPAIGIVFAVLEIGGFLAVLEQGPLLDQQLDVFRLLGKKCQIRADGDGNLLERVSDVGNAGIDALQQLPHDPI